MKVAIVGATGLVGNVMTRVLEERGFPVTEFMPVASERSIGKEVTFGDRPYPVIGMEEAVGRMPDIALFSAGGSTSLEWAPKFADAGSIVIDNSSAWRMDPSIRLVVPEINAHLLGPGDRIIANPNCSTIQMVMVLAPLHRQYGIARIVVSTYQSITGTGVKAVRQYEMERNDFTLEPVQMAYPWPIFGNCLPHCDVFMDNAYTREEMKLVHETRKILDAPEIGITATAVRVPVQGGHSEAVNVQFRQPFRLEDVREILTRTPGVTVMDDPAHNLYPMPLTAHQRDDVFVGRLRMDESQAHTLNAWIVADNLRKGAATNAVQIAEHMVARGLVGTIPADKIHT